MKVDVIINVYGKPWQTLCTLKSLMKHCAEHIDKIYIIEEAEQPYGDSIRFILDKFDNVIHYIPREYKHWARMTDFGDPNIAENRYCFRYQYGLENSDKKYVFITHNDVLYTDDIIGDMLVKIGDSAGIGVIGQCWNCTAFKAGECNSDYFYDYHPTMEEVVACAQQYPPARVDEFQRILYSDPNNVMPLPECRLNEFACIIDRGIYIKESFPNGDSPFFEEHSGIDSGCAWFKSMHLKGYKFKNYGISAKSSHMWYAKMSDVTVNSGDGVRRNALSYARVEDYAKQYYQSQWE